MIYWVCGGLAAIIVALTMHVLYLRREISRLSLHMSDCDLAKDIRQITIPLRDKKLEELASEINRIFDQHNDSLVDTRRKTAELKEFILEVSHDMRTPLTAVIGYLDVLYHTELDGSEQKRKTAAALSRADTLRELLENFFALSLADNNAYEANLERLDLTNLVSNALLQNYDALSKRGIVPHFDGDGAHVFITGDVSLMERVLQNLISNCVRYSVGDIDIELQDGVVPVMRLKNPVENIVKLDTDKLFLRFYSPDKSRTGGAVGLGLAIVERFLTLMGASISASKSGNNLVFTMQFQASRQEREGAN